MQPDDVRWFDSPDRSVRPGETPDDQVRFPEGGKAVVLRRAFPCPCTQCDVCGGEVDLTAVLWMDDWPVDTPEVGEDVRERPQDQRCRSFHLTIAPEGLEKQKTCSAGCELSPEDWELAYAVAFLALTLRYAREAGGGRG